MRRSRNRFNPSETRPYRLSRSKLDLFLECPRCFYLDRRLGVQRPALPGFSLNNAVDQLLKKEFDFYRARREAHAIMKKHGVEAVPFEHEDLDRWRDSLRAGVEYVHGETNFKVTGGIDDVWVKEDGELIVVDYKATSTQREISLDDHYKQGYKRQMEVYQWLLRRNGFQVSDTGYFLFCNGLTDRDFFDSKLEFNLELIAYTGSDAWIEEALTGARACLMSEDIPQPKETCEYCAYREAAQAAGI